jgi:multidrug efflux system membrane fusion protein
MTLRRLVLVVILLLALAGAGFFVASTSLPPAVQTVHPEIGPAVEAVYATGTVEPTTMVPISPRSTGRLVELLSDEGAQVQKDQVLARLEDSDLINSLDQLRAQRDYAQSEFDRKARLVDSGFVSKQDFDKAKSDLDAAQAAVRKAEDQAGYMKLVAPENGLILRRDGEVGQVVPAGQTVFWMSCCAPLRISSEVDEEDIPEVAPGLPVLIRADAFPGKVFKGTVKSITPKGDSVARSYRVRVELSEDTPLMIGMTAETNIILRESKDALLIPATAVRDGKVQKIENDRITEVPVTFGAKGAEKVEILEGVSKDDRVVTTFRQDLKTGDEIRPSGKR